MSKAEAFDVAYRSIERLQRENTALQTQINTLTAQLETKLHTCPDCAFTFDAIHTDEGGGYSCPCCAEAGLTAQLTEMQSEQGWQDISTAPKDGTRILVSNDCCPVTIAKCFGGELGSGRWLDDEGNEIEPTHWRPLPAPPSAVAVYRGGIREEGRMNEAAVTYCGVLDMQVCVPDEWTDEQVKAFADTSNPAGTQNGWFIRRTGDKALMGHPERQTCANHSDMVHIMLDA